MSCVRIDIAVALLVGLNLTGCGRSQAPGTTDSASGAGVAAKGESRSYPLSGIVRAVDRSEGFVTVRHEEIPGFMPAMTMPLRVLDAAALEDVQVGDRIEATLRVDPGKSALVDLVVTQPATMELSTAGGTLELRPKPPLLEPGEEVPDFQMTLQDGKSASLSSFRGKFVVLTFTYTRCPVPDFCPLIDRKFQELDRIVRRVPARAEAVRLLSVSFDPEHDTPKILAKHAERVGARPPGWSFAVASHDELRKIAPVLGLGYGPGENEIMHNLRTAVIDPEGRLVVLENGNSWQPEKLIQAFQSLILPARK